MKNKNSYSGREQVKAKLVKSACKLLSENGPRKVTIRDIATDAGVNHGQIHHYFGGKKKLLTVAMGHLAREHAEHVAERGFDEHFAPQPLTLGKDKQYIMAVIRSVLDGELELATLEIDDDISVPRHMLEELTKSLGHKKPTVEIKSAMAILMAIELSWAALEPYILTMLDVKSRETNKIRQMVAQASREILKRLDPPK